MEKVEAEMEELLEKMANELINEIPDATTADLQRVSAKHFPPGMPRPSFDKMLAKLQEVRKKKAAV